MLKGVAWLKAVNVFQYVTFRAIAAATTALVLSLLLGPLVIGRLRKLRLHQPHRDAGDLHGLEQEPDYKRSVPTMGGILIVGAVLCSTVLWMRWSAELVWLALFCMTALGAVGLADDYLKVSRGNPKGLPWWGKIFAQCLIGLIVGALLYLDEERRSVISALYVPFLKVPLIPTMGVLAIVFIELVIVASSNAVNLTDGLDGLAIGCVVMVAGVYALFTYISGTREFAEHFLVPYVNGSGELTVVCAALVGAGLGYLWFNSAPAEVFMGDSGSLALGGALGVIAVMCRQEIALLLVGGMFVIEALSVILQVGSFKLRGGKRIFLMTPLHHHFEKLGWARTKITVRFWILSIVFALIGVGTLKLR
jgi:phospho-N-acetylmuramoyl-pentapeptide-transferase